MNLPARRNRAPHRAVPDDMTALQLPGHIRVDITATDPALAQQAAAQLAGIWHTGPAETQTDDGLHVVTMYARPEHQPDTT